MSKAALIVIANPRQLSVRQWRSPSPTKRGTKGHSVSSRVPSTECEERCRGRQTADGSRPEADKEYSRAQEAEEEEKKKREEAG